MKFLGQRPSKNKEAIIYDFVIGAVELSIMWGILNQALKNTPRVIETQIFRARLRELVKTLELQKRANNIK
jgi:hypothetical protein